MSGQATVDDRARMRRWVETWQHTGVELDEVRRPELQSLDRVEGAAQEAIRQIFESSDAGRDLPPRTTSGLVEQQVWFAKLRSEPCR
jgi:hypothetical protein